MHDGAIPSGNAVSAYNLIRLGRMIGNGEFEQYGYKTLQVFSWEISNFPSAHTFSLIALDLVLNGSKELVIVPVGENWLEPKEYLDRLYIPDLMILKKDSVTERFSKFINQMKVENNKDTYYLCSNYVCEEPITDINVLNEKLKGKKRKN